MVSVMQRSGRPAPPQLEVSCMVPQAVKAGLDRLAREAKVPARYYIGNLLQAAYAARLKPTGDRDLDAAVARVALLLGTRNFNTVEIAAHVGLSEATVASVVAAWRDEMAGGGA